MTMSFAFAGRYSTEDQQDPEASRNWQFTRAQALIEPYGVMVAEFFEPGSRGRSRGSAARRLPLCWTRSNAPTAVSTPW